MRSLLVLGGWPELPVPAGAWSGSDAAGHPLVLAHGDEPHAVSPVAANERRSVHVVLSGEIYNRRELRASLTGRHTVDGADDAELVAHLYEERGVQCVSALRGAFAVALWDERRRRLLLARDQLGLVPLYYAHDRGRLAAASRLPPLVALPGLATAWDVAGLDAFLTFGGVPPPATLYPAIRQLFPGEMLVWEDGRLRAQRYWQLAFPERRLARGDLSAFLRTQLVEALRLRQAGAVGSLLLSGGLDAAALLVLARADGRSPARAYTAAPAGTLHEDVRAAARLAIRAGVPHVVLDEPPDWCAEVDTLLAAQGGPAGGAGAVVLRWRPRGPRRTWRSCSQAWVARRSSAARRRRARWSASAATGAFRPSPARAPRSGRASRRRAGAAASAASSRRSASLPSRCTRAR
jgi:asparagine synthetase B (glutamine-hydrolysing)